MSKPRKSDPDQVLTLYVSLAPAPDGDERIAGILTPKGLLPLVCSRSLDELLDRCQKIADTSDQTVQVVKFERAGVVGKFRPGADVSRMVGGSDG